MRKPTRFSVLLPSTAGFERLSSAATAICCSQAGQRLDPSLGAAGNLANVGIDQILNLRFSELENQLAMGQHCVKSSDPMAIGVSIVH
jgi:hypothetical protein